MSLSWVASSQFETMAGFVTLRDSLLEDQGQQPRAVADVGRERAGKITDAGQRPTSVPIPKFAQLCSTQLVSRFRSSPNLAARPMRTSESKDTSKPYDSSAALNPKFATGLAAIAMRTSGSRHW